MHSVIIKIVLAMALIGGGVYWSMNTPSGKRITTDTVDYIKVNFLGGVSKTYSNAPNKDIVIGNDKKDPFADVTKETFGDIPEDTHATTPSDTNSTTSSTQNTDELTQDTEENRRTDDVISDEIYDDILDFDFNPEADNNQDASPAEIPAPKSSTDVISGATDENKETEKNIKNQIQPVQINNNVDVTVFDNGGEALNSDTSTPESAKWEDGILKPSGEEGEASGINTELSIEEVISNAKKAIEKSQKPREKRSWSDSGHKDVTERLWSIKVGDSASKTITRWAKKQGYKTDWRPGFDLIFDLPQSMVTDFHSAMNILLKGIQKKGINLRIYEDKIEKTIIVFEGETGKTLIYSTDPEIKTL